MRHTIAVHAVGVTAPPAEDQRLRPRSVSESADPHTTQRTKPTRSRWEQLAFDGRAVLDNLRSPPRHSCLKVRSADCQGRLSRAARWKKLPSGGRAGLECIERVNCCSSLCCCVLNTSSRALSGSALGEGRDEGPSAQRQRAGAGSVTEAESGAGSEPGAT